MAVEETVKRINTQVERRAVRAKNAIRNAELEVLKGQRSGRRYRKPGSKSMYTASAPGEPPARRTGALRLQWTGGVESSGNGSGGISVRPYIESGTPYAATLESGTSRMAPRPYVERIQERAEPEIVKIMSESYE